MTEQDVDSVMRAVLGFTGSIAAKKSTQKRVKILLHYILSLKPILVDRFPYFIRLVALIRPLFPDLVESFAQVVVNEANDSVQKCHNLDRTAIKGVGGSSRHEGVLNIKLKWVRMFAECVKFGLIQPGQAFALWIRCLKVNSSYGFFLFLTLLEQLGRFLYCSLETYNLSIELLKTTQSMINKRKISTNNVYLVLQAISFCTCTQLLTQLQSQSTQSSSDPLSTSILTNVSTASSPTSGNLALDMVYGEDLLQKYIKYCLRQVLDDDLPFSSALQILTSLPWNHDQTSHFDTISSQQVNLISRLGDIGSLGLHYDQELHKLAQNGQNNQFQALPSQNGLNIPNPYGFSRLDPLSPP